MEVERKVTNVFVFQNGMVVTFDQFGEQMPGYQGHKNEVLDKIKTVYSGPVEVMEWHPRPIRDI